MKWTHIHGPRTGCSTHWSLYVHHFLEQPPSPSVTSFRLSTSYIWLRLLALGEGGWEYFPLEDEWPSRMFVLVSACARAGTEWGVTLKKSALVTLTLVRCSLRGKQFAGVFLVAEYSLRFVHPSPPHLLNLSFVSFAIRELSFLTNENMLFGTCNLENACTSMHLAVKETGISGSCSQFVKSTANNPEFTNGISLYVWPCQLSRRIVLLYHLCHLS